MLTRTLARLATASRNVHLTPRVSAEDAAKYQSFVKGISEGYFGGEVTAIWRNKLSSSYRGVEKEDGRAIRNMLTAVKSPSPLVIAQALVKFLKAMHKQEYLFSEDCVIAFLSSFVPRIRSAKRIDVTCAVGTKTYSLVQEQYRTFKWFKDNGHTITQRVYTVVIQGASQARFSTLVRFAVREMQSDGFSPDVFIISMIISSLRASTSAKPEVVQNLRRETYRVWTDMTALKVAPDHHCFVTMIGTLMSFGMC